MFYCPFCDPSNTLYRMPSINSYIRFFHASPNSPAVDVFIDETLIARGISYSNFSPYFEIIPGTHSLRVYPSERRDRPVINTRVTIPERTILTAPVIGELPNLSILTIPEPKLSNTPGKAYVRFSHLSPDTPPVDVTLPGGQKLFTNIGYQRTSEYIPVNPDNYTINLNISPNGQRVLHIPNIRLLPNKIYTIYAIGLLTKTPPLEVVIPLDGNTYLKV